MNTEQPAESYRNYYWCMSYTDFLAWVAAKDGSHPQISLREEVL